jgi:phosphoserine aminotransferase
MTYNFCAGPAILPESVLKKAQALLLDFESGVSILSISHRDRAFEEIGVRIKAKLRQILSITDDYEIILMQGGATLQFSAIPMNFAQDKTVAYVNTAAWSKKAMQEAAKFSEVVELDKGYLSAAEQRFDQQDAKGVQYIHFTDNETIDGVEFQYVPKVEGIPIICDISSSFLSRKITINDFDLLYAGAQKNIGPSGVTIVIVKKSLLETINGKSIPTVLDYAQNIKSNSLLNTPVTFSWAVVDLVLDWFLESGGIEHFEALNHQKSTLIYTAIDALPLFSNAVPKAARSRMNVIFNLSTERLCEKFLAEAETAGFYGLKGHRSVGGCRASLYNAMDLKGVQTLVDFMTKFNEVNL